MADTTPRLRMFAGPNGSGKSTIKQVVPAELRGIYINADDIEREIVRTRSIDLTPFKVQTSLTEIMEFYGGSSLLNLNSSSNWISSLTLSNNTISFPESAVSSYLASTTADFIRMNLLGQKLTFTFETVMSHSGKIDILKKAKSMGYRTYLYFIATEDPEINVSRVKVRVLQGGHDVPEVKIRSRYYRSLENLFDAILYSDRAYIWDNSGGPNDQSFVAEAANGVLEIKCNQLPVWFKTYVLDKLPA